jgi:methyl-accepting chemotaxis protein
MKLHRTMTVSMRLSLGFGLLIGLLAVVAVTSLVRLQASSKGVNDLALARLPKLAASTTWVESLQQSARLMRDTLILDDEKQIKEAIEIISKGRQQRNDLGAELGKLISTEKEKELLTNIVNVHAEYAPNEDKYLKSASSGDLSTAKDVMLDKVRPAQIKYISAINEFRNLQSTLSGEEAKDIVGSNKASGTLILTLALVALLSGLIAAFLIIRALIRQLGGEPTYAAEVVQQIADGNLANEVIVRQNDTASLLAAMKRMQDNLRGTVLQIKSTAETISNASSEISQGNNDLNGRTAQQASALEQTSAASAPSPKKCFSICVARYLRARGRPGSGGFR